MGVLMLLFIGLFVLVVIGQFLLYQRHERTIGFIWNTILGILLSYLIFTSLPSNEMTEKILSLSWGILAIIALVIGKIFQKNELLSKVLFSLSVIGGCIHLFFLP